MTRTHNSPANSIHRGSMAKRMLIGAAIALAFISLFLYKADEGDPAWGKYWMIRPFVLVPLAGAMGGLFYHIVNNFWGQEGGWKKVAAIIIGILGFIVAVWMGIVVGLDGTMWD